MKVEGVAVEWSSLPLECPEWPKPSSPVVPGHLQEGPVAMLFILESGARMMTRVAVVGQDKSGLGPSGDPVSEDAERWWRSWATNASITAVDAQEWMGQQVDAPGPQAMETCSGMPRRSLPWAAACWTESANLGIAWQRRK